MKDKLIQYVDLLFAGVESSEEIKQEILQNTLDRYDDLIAEGKVPEAAYRLAITGIGDINEILGTKVPFPADQGPAPQAPEEDTPEKKRKRAIAIALYILCPVPLLILGNIGPDILAILGICCMLAIVAFATYLMLVNAKKDDEEKEEKDSPLLKSIKNTVWSLAVVVYLVLSFTTFDWHITWIVFLIAGAVNNLAAAILDLKEGKNK